MPYQTFIADILIATGQMLLALTLGVLSVYTGIGLLDRLTWNIDEWKEIKKGNAAIGIVVLSIVFSIVWIVAPRIERVVGVLQMDGSLPILIMVFLAEMVYLLITLVVATFTVYTAVRLLDYMTMDIDENAELKRGNMAVAFVLASLMLGIVWITSHFIFQWVEKIDIVQWIGA